MVERIDWFSALVPDALQPVNQDGEVQRFERLELTEVQGWMLQGVSPRGLPGACRLHGLVGRQSS
jgi:hypothetical protein